MFLSFNGFAQTKKKPKKIKTQSFQFEFQEMPEIKDFAFVIQIDRDSDITLKIQKKEDSEYVTNSSKTETLNEFFLSFSNLQNAKSQSKTKSALEPIIIVKADRLLRFEEIVKVIKSVRVSPTQKIKLQISDNLYAAIPQKPVDNPNVIWRPNPLTLLVYLKNDRKFTLNNEPFGNFENIFPLTDKMKQIFKEREENGIFREGTNEVEKTVFVKMPLSVNFEEVIGTIEKLFATGASPIILQIDDLEK